MVPLRVAALVCVMVYDNFAPDRPSVSPSVYRHGIENEQPVSTWIPKILVRLMPPLIVASVSHRVILSDPEREVVLAPLVSIATARNRRVPTSFTLSPAVSMEFSQ